MEKIEKDETKRNSLEKRRKWGGGWRRYKRNESLEFKKNKDEDAEKKQQDEKKEEYNKKDRKVGSKEECNKKEREEWTKEKYNKKEREVDSKEEYNKKDWEVGSKEQGRLEGVRGTLPWGQVRFCDRARGNLTKKL